MESRRSIYRFVIICLVVLSSSGYSESDVSDSPSVIQVLQTNTIDDFNFGMPAIRRIGSEDAPLVLIEFSDYECNHCSVFHEVLFPKIKSEYIDTGLIFYVALNHPNRNHKVGAKAAEASYCAGDQGHFWAMRDLLFENSLFLKEELITELAQDLALDQVEFAECLRTGTYTELVEAEKNCGKSVGVSATPTFILAEKDKHRAINGKLVKGVLRWSKFKKPVSDMLKRVSENQ